jgi:pimeloyl-ACP methyl ester carboxylesterase
VLKAICSRHALAVDPPGFAGSPNLPGPYTMEAYADAVAALLDERGIGRAVLVGGSMGGT